MTCPNCGATLTGEARSGATLRCEYCGTPVRVPAPSEAAAPNIRLTSHGDLNIREFVGGDKIVTRQITESDAPLPAPLPRPAPNVLNTPALPNTPPPASRRGWILGLVAVGCTLCIALPVACGVLSLFIYR